MPDISLFILAGGNSTRMGTDKGLMIFQDKPMIAHLIDRFKNIIPEIVIVSNNKEYQQFEIQVINDRHLNCGPLAGIEAGLSFSKHNKNIFLTCDSPLVEFALIEYLILNSKEVEIVFSNYKKYHPFPGLYSSSIKEKLNQLIIKGVRKISDLECHFKTTHLDCDSFNRKNFINFNTPNDIKSWNEINY